MATARKPAAKKSARKTAKKTTKKTAKKAATKRTTARKAPTKRTSAKKATTKRTTAKKAATRRTTARKTTAKKTATRRTTAKKAITPKQALANTRKLLAQKQAQARATPPWQALDDHHDQAPHAGFQSDGARVQAEELHEAEARLQGTHGSISTHDRHNQGKRDQRS